MGFNPDEPRDDRGRWSRIGGAIKNFKEKHGKTIVKILDKGIGYAIDAKSHDAQASRAVLRKAEALRKKNNDIANQRTRHPGDYPHTAAPLKVKTSKTVGGAYPSNEAWNALAREIQRAQGLSQVPEERMRRAQQQPKVMPDVITVLNEAGRPISARMPTPPQKNFVPGPGWKGKATGHVDTGVIGSQLSKHQNALGSVKLDVSKPLTRPEGNLQPYKAAAYNTRAVFPTRTTEYPPTRYTTQPVVRRKLPKE